MYSRSDGRKLGYGSRGFSRPAQARAEAFEIKSCCWRDLLVRAVFVDGTIETQWPGAARVQRMGKPRRAHTLAAGAEAAVNIAYVNPNTVVGLHHTVSE